MNSNRIAHFVKNDDRVERVKKVFSYALDMDEILRAFGFDVSPKIIRQMAISSSQILRHHDVPVYEWDVREN